MGSTAADYDSDGDEDLYVTNFQRDYNTLFRNDGALSFEDVTAASGLALPTLSRLGWGALFLDVGNDGDPRPLRRERTYLSRAREASRGRRAVPPARAAPSGRWSGPVRRGRARERRARSARTGHGGRRPRPKRLARRRRDQPRRSSRPLSERGLTSQLDSTAACWALPATATASAPWSRSAGSGGSIVSRTVFSAATSRWSISGSRMPSPYRASKSRGLRERAISASTSPRVGLM